MDCAELERELAYYKRQLDEMAGARISTEHRQWVLQARLRQKGQGFSLLAKLAQSVGAETGVGAMFRISVREINTMLAMDRTLILVPNTESSRYAVAYSAGLRDDEAAALTTHEFDLTEDAKSLELWWMGRDGERTPLAERVRALTGLASFIWAPVLGPSAPIGIIVSGRMREHAMFSPPLDQGDADTFRAITGVLSASVRNTQLSLLEQTHRLKSELFANASHELRTPLTLAHGPLTQVLSGRWGELSAPVRERLTMVEHNQARLLSHVNELLDVARSHTDSAALMPMPLGDLHRLIEECALHFRAAAEVRGIALSLNLWSDAKDLTLLGDAGKLERLLFNLLSNALKFTDAGRVDVTTSRAQDALKITVADTGIGLSSEELDGLFVRYARVEAASVGRPAGSGIGLSLVKEIVTLHGGQIEVASEKGKGATFTVTLPLTLRARVAHEAEAARVPASSSGERGDVRTLNARSEREFLREKPVILCVDDDADMRAYLRDVLGAEHNVFVASDGDEALEAARRYLPELIVTDQWMPRMTGDALMNAVLADPELSSTPFIFLTAQHERGSRLSRLRSGAHDYITKPFDEAELSARCQNLIRLRKQERLLEEANRKLERRLREQMAELVHSGEIKRFLPRVVVESLSRTGMGEGPTFGVQHLTVLEVHVSSFVSESATPPGELAAMLDEYFGTAATVAASHGGTVHSLAGGRVSVLFGAPEPCTAEDGAWAALQTGLQLRRALSELSANARRRGLSANFVSRVTLASGRCLVGALGSQALRAYTAVGAPVDSALELQTIAPAGSVVCASNLHETLSQRARLRPLGEAFEVLEFASVRPADPAHEAPSFLSQTPSTPIPISRMCRREGDYWTLTYGGALLRLRDAKGLEYLARLLSHPGQQIHVLDLVAFGGEGMVSALDGGELTVKLETDVGPVLDASAKAAYRARLRELDEELNEAQRCADEGKITRAEQEIEALAAQLSSALGLGGRDRKTGSATERARVNVRRALKAVVDKVGSSHVELARHLETSLQTGTFCSYRPHPGVPDSWDVSLQ